MYNKKLAFMEFIGSAFVFSFGMLVKYAFILSEGDVWSFFISGSMRFACSWALTILIWRGSISARNCRVLCRKTWQRKWRSYRCVFPKTSSIWQWRIRWTSWRLRKHSILPKRKLCRWLPLNRRWSVRSIFCMATRARQKRYFGVASAQ